MESLMFIKGLFKRKRKKSLEKSIDEVTATVESSGSTESPCFLWRRQNWKILYTICL